MNIDKINQKILELKNTFLEETGEDVDVELKIDPKTFNTLFLEHVTKYMYHSFTPLFKKE